MHACISVAFSSSTEEDSKPKIHSSIANILSRATASVRKANKNVEKNKIKDQTSQPVVGKISNILFNFST